MGGKNGRCPCIFQQLDKTVRSGHACNKLWNHRSWLMELFLLLLSHSGIKLIIIIIIIIIILC